MRVKKETYTKRGHGWGSRKAERRKGREGEGMKRRRWGKGEEEMITGGGQGGEGRGRGERGGKARRGEEVRIRIVVSVSVTDSTRLDSSAFPASLPHSSATTRLLGCNYSCLSALSIRALLRERRTCSALPCYRQPLLPITELSPHLLSLVMYARLHSFTLVSSLVAGKFQSIYDGKFNYFRSTT